jgi:hypothetical protein
MQTTDKLRLLTSYRGYRRGDVIEATPALAAHLLGAGIAVRETQGDLIPAETTERATAAQANVRHATR